MPFGAWRAFINRYDGTSPVLPACTIQLPPLFPSTRYFCPGKKTWPELPATLAA
jgi:hypothetical protein